MVPSSSKGHCWGKTTTAPASQQNEAGRGCSDRNLQTNEKTKAYRVQASAILNTWNYSLKKTSPPTSFRSSSSGTVVILLTLLWLSSEISICGSWGEPRFDFLESASASSSSVSFFVLLPVVISFSMDSWCISSSSKSALLLMSCMESLGLLVLSKGSK